MILTLRNNNKHSHHPSEGAMSATTAPPPRRATTSTSSSSSFCSSSSPPTSLTAPAVSTATQPIHAHIVLPTLPSPDTQRHVVEARAAVVASMGNLLDSKLQSRARVLHENAAALDKQEREVLRATEGLRRETDKLAREADVAAKKVKELGNVQNWAEVLERGFLVLEETVRLANREGSGGESDDADGGSGGSCSCSDCGSGSGSDGDECDGAMMDVDVDLANSVHGLGSGLDSLARGTGKEGDRLNGRKSVGMAPGTTDDEATVPETTSLST